MQTFSFLSAAVVVSVFLLLCLFSGSCNAKPTRTDGYISSEETETETHLTAEDFLRHPPARDGPTAHQHRHSNNGGHDHSHHRHQHRHSSRSDPTLGGRFEGDMVISDHESHSTHDQIQHTSLRNRNQRWPHGIVPYTVSSNYNDDQRSRIAKAIQDFHDHTCIHWVPRNHTDPAHRDFIFMAPRGHGCFSNVGRVGGRQILSLNLACFEEHGTLLHELMHVLGFVHEQSRTDRDDYIEIITENMMEGMAENFKKYPTTHVDSLGEPYDYGSVMHYNRYAFSKDYFSDTIRPKISSPAAERMGQREGFSETDLRKINKLYECSKEKVKSKTCQDRNWRCSFYALPEVGACNKHSRIRFDLCPKSCKTCETEEVHEAVNCRDHNSNCPDWAQRGQCSSHNGERQEAMLILCPVSCEACNVE